jgi:hypothetical protein
MRAKLYEQCFVIYLSFTGARFQKKTVLGLKTSQSDESAHMLLTILRLDPESGHHPQTLSYFHHS